MKETSCVVGSRVLTTLTAFTAHARLSPMTCQTCTITLERASTPMDTGLSCPSKPDGFSCGTSCKSSHQQRTPSFEMWPHFDLCHGWAANWVSALTCSSKNAWLNFPKWNPSIQTEFYRLESSTCLEWVMDGKHGTTWGMLWLTKSLWEVELTSLQWLSTSFVASWWDCPCQGSCTFLTWFSHKWCRYALQRNLMVSNFQAVSLLETSGWSVTKVPLSRSLWSESFVCFRRTLALNTSGLTGTIIPYSFLLTCMPKSMLMCGPISRLRRSRPHGRTWQWASKKAILFYFTSNMKDSCFRPYSWWQGQYLEAKVELTPTNCGSTFFLAPRNLRGSLVYLLRPSVSLLSRWIPIVSMAPWHNVCPPRHPDQWSPWIKSTSLVIVEVPANWKFSSTCLLRG